MDDFQNRAEAEMRLHDAKMIERIRYQKMKDKPLDERVRAVVNDHPEISIDQLIVFMRDKEILCGDTRQAVEESVTRQGLPIRAGL
jgi:hypothetical protein